MKIVQTLLIVIAVFAFAGAAQAQEDPYSGTYSCSGPSKPCGDCDVAPPSGVVISKVSGNTYQFCPQYDSNARGTQGSNGCVTMEINNGEGHWSGTNPGEGVTFSGEVNLKFDGSQLTAEEIGTFSGMCECETTLTGICTK
ncbi:hypothetical protein [Pseudodesulfovibrio sp.]|uniref:hypothetical protein n=1 Tax=unclassified Pseudodesulfovibrio TaxID=2661612 RepID=UPI003B00C1A2